MGVDAQPAMQHGLRSDADLLTEHDGAQGALQVP
jgi:hypothetical protein